MSEHFYAVIMAGGGGTRLWPVSRRDRPKQTLALFENRSLFQIAVDRIMPIIPVGRIYVVTIEEQAAILKEQAPQIPSENFIMEPSPRGTASVVGLAAEFLRKRDPDAVMACLTADHFMRNEEYLRELLLSSYDAAMDSFLVTLGITPDFPATGYGYIQRGEQAGSYRNRTAYHVKAFKEKPDQQTAESYVRDGNYLWNSGMFIWRADRILGEISKSMPGLDAHLDSIGNAIGTAEERLVLQQEWAQIIPQTIDYGVMEKAEQVLVIPASDLGWLDLGSWDRIPELLSSDEDGNVIHADRNLILNSRNTIVFQESAEKSTGRLVAALGVQDLIVVDTDDILLLCHKSMADDVKLLVQKLKDDGENSYL